MKHKTSELEGALLDAFVRKAVGKGLGWAGDLYQPSTNWAHGGPLLDEHIGSLEKEDGRLWWAEPGGFADSWAISKGPTMLIAACRAIVLAKLGEEVEL